MSVFWIIPVRLLMPPITEPWNSLGATTCQRVEMEASETTHAVPTYDVASRISCCFDNQTPNGPVGWLQEIPRRTQSDAYFVQDNIGNIKVILLR